MSINMEICFSGFQNYRFQRVSCHFSCSDIPLTGKTTENILWETSSSLLRNGQTFVVCSSEHKETFNFLELETQDDELYDGEIITF